VLLHSSVSLYPIPSFRNVDRAAVYQGNTCPLLLLPCIFSFFLNALYIPPSHLLLVICAPFSLLSAIQTDYNSLSSSVRLPFFSNLAQLLVALLSSSISLRGLERVCDTCTKPLSSDVAPARQWENSWLPVTDGMSARGRVTLILCITWTPNLEGIIVDTLNGFSKARVNGTR
jgi:hypothetical protein